ncbi:hypothetical protein [Hydrogenovibrio marinus]|uniref:Uncharacterized protein n=1 Tax=Hydrogenovibrio marinus TaxID=28885 RepID=A0A066ZQC1_HYDMR|nr:hypothetical protein [Hydrogenovibrio marinus]KDN96013.1 hypothetical protein EI16_06925 [Hydrogenovibrio marinus]BBN58491.1 hypothetical protein HVMH_0085 [Hydrogenovibrio marinus]
MNLESTLNTWNGHPDDLKSIYRQFKIQPDFVMQLLPLLKQKQQRGASELLKIYLGNQGQLPEGSTTSILKSLCVTQSWQTQENLLACLPFLHPYPKPQQAALAHFIHNALHSTHKSVAVLAEQAVTEYEKDFPDQPFAQFLSEEEKAMDDVEDKKSNADQQMSASLF